jgi:hypothetical protein
MTPIRSFTTEAEKNLTRFTNGESLSDFRSNVLQKKKKKKKEKEKEKEKAPQQG